MTKIFLLSCFVIYGGLHYYLYKKIFILFCSSKPIDILIRIFLFIMTLSLYIIHYLEKYNFDTLTKIFAYIGYNWAGFIFIFFSIALSFDVIQFILNNFIKLNLFYNPKINNCLILLLSFLFSIYGFFEAKNIHINKIIINTSKLPVHIKKIRIAQISDVHLGILVQPKRLNNMIRLIQNEHPDIIVSTGDLVDSNLKNIIGLVEPFRKLNAPLGKFAVLGNHEYYAGLSESIQFTKNAGFQLLRNDSITVGSLITISGVDDHIKSNSSTEKKLLETLPKNKFRLFLKHRPIVNDSRLFDLQISGHIHNGQIFPFRLFTNLIFKYKCGLYNLSDDSKIYVSSGTGTWGPMIRFLSPPEITIFEITNREPYQTYLFNGQKK